ncbi:hypothetical protein RJ640_006092 [Escallonia rubra]|uniref:Actin-related protein 6 n=1 Tax=Escallonia rubra TaxID=112253 RepID=A0AA88SIU6_9ASTE|nr:hypothetical protein RJ640_006092 [Escallonia rubra]
MSSSNVVVLDNGGGLIKAGIGGERDPTAVVPNCLARPAASKKFLMAEQLLSATADLTSATLRRPFDRGYLVNPDLQSSLWSHLFSSLLRVTPSTSSLLLTEPLFNLPSIQRSTDEIVFEEFGFRSLFVADSPSLVHLYEASRQPYGLVSKAQCSLVVDCGFSFTHCAPVFQNFTVNYGVKRMDLGGKALTNYLKEIVSYRSVNVMDESFLMDDVKEKLCFVSLDVAQDLKVSSVLKCTYVLPDGVTHLKGFVKDPDKAQRYLALRKRPPSPDPGSEETDELEVTKKPEDKNKIDLTKNEFSLTNERFLVPEMIFRPADLGMNQAGLSECIVRAISSCHPRLHPVLYESPILGVWRGGSLLASSPDFEAMCVTKEEYEELGSARCRRRFFH